MEVRVYNLVELDVVVIMFNEIASRTSTPHRQRWDFTWRQITLHCCRVMGMMT